MTKNKQDNQQNNSNPLKMIITLVVILGVVGLVIFLVVNGNSDDSNDNNQASDTTTQAQNDQNEENDQQGDTMDVSDLSVSGISFANLTATVMVKESAEFETIESLVLDSDDCENTTEGWEEVAMDGDMTVSIDQTDVDNKRYFCLRGLLADDSYEYDVTVLDEDKYQSVDHSDDDDNNTPGQGQSEPGSGVDDNTDNNTDNSNSEN